MRCIPREFASRMVPQQNKLSSRTPIVLDVETRHHSIAHTSIPPSINMCFGWDNTKESMRCKHCLTHIISQAHPQHTQSTKMHSMNKKAVPARIAKITVSTGNEEVRTPKHRLGKYTGTRIPIRRFQTWVPHGRGFALLMDTGIICLPSKLNKTSKFYIWVSLTSAEAQTH